MKIKLPVTAIILLFCFFLFSGCGGYFHRDGPFTFFKQPSSADPSPGPDIADGESELQQPPSGAGIPDIDATASSMIMDAESEPVLTTQAPPIQAALDEALDFCKAAQDLWQKGELENAILALDQAYALLLEGDDSQIPEIIQQKDDIRFLISRRILEIYASRNVVVNGENNAIPILINDEVQREIDLFTTGREREFFINSLQRSGQYRPYIVKELQAAGLPVELSWLPLIESGFKPRALSPARALGLWQFIPSTGYRFGLERNMYIDERLDPEKSTAAAIKYLTALHQIFGDWSTVLAAYNGGEGRVLRTIRTQRINYLDDFWDLYKQLPRETARYVPRFLATLHVVSNLDAYGMGEVELLPPLAYEKVAVSRQVHLKEIARTIDVAQGILEGLNPELRHQVLPSAGYPVKIPVGKTEALLAGIDSLPTSSAPEQQFVYHRVRSGEALSTIARRYRTTVSNIARANNIHQHNHIRAGRLLKIPLSRHWQEPTPAPQQKAAGAVRHVVSRGESLWVIARRYGTTVDTIKRINGLASTTLRIGQVLELPGQQKKGTYQVQSGDSPFTIASRHRMSLERFLTINNLNKSSTIYPGQMVFVE